MSSDSERLIDGLVADLDPVDPLPRARVGLAGIAIVWAGVAAWSLQGLDHAPGVANLGQEPLYGLALLGLAAAGFAGAGAAILGTRPGRETEQRHAAGLALVVFGAAVVACAVGFLGSERAMASSSGIDGACFQRSFLLSVLPGLAIGRSILAGWPGQPLVAGALAIGAAGALGALAVHLVCDLATADHLLTAHLSVPLVAAAVGCLPAGFLLARLRG